MADSAENTAPPLHAERLIARRYLFRLRRSRAMAVVTAVFGMIALCLLGAYFLSPQQALHGPVLGALAIVGPLAFLVVLLLNFFSVFSTVAVVGVMLGVAALTVVLAVTSGFQREIQKRVIGVNAHVVVLKYGTDFHEYEDVLRKVQANRQVSAAAPFVFNEMLITRDGGSTAGVIVKGIDVVRGGKVLDVEGWLLPGPGGKAPPLQALQIEQAPAEGGPPLPGAFLGKELARKLKVKVGDRVRLVAPLLGLDGAMLEEAGSSLMPPKSTELRVSGIFTAGFAEYDQRLVYMDLRRAQALLGQGDVATGVEMVVRDPSRAGRVAKELEGALGGLPYRILDWEELNRNLFTALALQKGVLGLVLFLIVLVAAFNIVSSLTMMVIDKGREVAILKAMGMTSFSVSAVFSSAGMTIGLCGTVLGLTMGLLTCAVVRRMGYLLDAKVYLIDRLPIQIAPIEVVLVGLTTLVICFGATLYPALRAAALHPVDGLRYE